MGYELELKALVLSWTSTTPGARRAPAMDPALTSMSLNPSISRNLPKMPSSPLPHFIRIEAAKSLKVFDTYTEGQARHSLRLCGNPLFERFVAVVNFDEEARHGSDA